MIFRRENCLLIKPILKVLQEAGAQLERSEIKARIADMDDQIAEFAEIEKKSKKMGNKSSTATASSLNDANAVYQS